MAARRRGQTLHLNDVLDNIGIGRFHWRLLFACGFGFSAAAVEIVLTAFLFVELRREWDLNEFQLSVVPTTVTIGCILGQASWGYAADLHGRRTIFLVTVFMVVIFGIASAFAQDLWTFCALRFLVGVGFGGNIAVDFALFSELVPTHGRGRLLFAMSAFWPIGQILSCLIAWYTIPVYGWRGFLVASSVPSFLTIFVRPFIPESPRWLLLHGQEEQAMEVCTHMAAVNLKRPEDVGLAENVSLTLQSETDPIVQPSGQEHNIKPLRRLFGKSLIRTTLGCFVFSALLGFGGYATTTFMPSFLALKGMGSQGIYMSMTLSSLSQIPGILIAAMLAHNFGRLVPVQSSLLLLAVALATFATAQTQQQLIACSCFAAFSLELGYALYHVYTVEAFPTELRATAQGVVSSSGSIAGTITPFFTAWLLQTGVDRVVWTFAIVCSLGSLLLFILLHEETAERHLQDKASNDTSA